MATLTNAEKRKIRNAVERKANKTDIPITWIKAAVHDAAQVIEDALSGDDPILRAECAPTVGTGFDGITSSRIDTATTPHGVTFTNQEKKWLAAVVMEVKYTRDILG
jgi:hypothetical protein